MVETPELETWYDRFNRLAGDLYPGRYSRGHVKGLVELGQQVLELARQKNSSIIAHNYVYPELQEVAEVVGDSLGLSLYAKQRGAPRVDFCGVWFMGETVKILLGDSAKVYMPDRPGCSLASAVDHHRIAEWTACHPDGVVLAYVNTDAETKAKSHYVCTSANAAQVLKHVAERHAGQRILFLPDKYLSAFATAQAPVNRNLVDFYPSFCHVHAKMGGSVLEEAQTRHPGAELLVHPECAGAAVAPSSAKVLGDAHFLSSEQMVVHAKRSAAREFIVATETGMLYRLRRECPQKRFYPASDSAICEFMKMNTLEKLRDSLRYDRFEVEVDQSVRERAGLAVEGMLEIR